MTKVKLELQTISVPEKIRKARQVIAQLTGNPHFPGAAALIAELSASTSSLESDYDSAIEARNAAAAKTATLNSTERSFDGVLTRVGSHVEDASPGDEAKIKSAGLDVRSERRPVGELPAVSGLTVSVGDSDGELDLHWDRGKGAQSYTLAGLTSGHRIRVRVAAIGTAGQGPWSDPVAKIVP